MTVFMRETVDRLVPNICRNDVTYFVPHALLSVKSSAQYPDSSLSGLQIVKNVLHLLFPPL